MASSIPVTRSMDYQIMLQSLDRPGNAGVLHPTEVLVEVRWPVAPEVAGSNPVGWATHPRKS